MRNVLTTSRNAHIHGCEIVKDELREIANDRLVAAQHFELADGAEQQVRRISGPVAGLRLSDNRFSEQMCGCGVMTACLHVHFRRGARRQIVEVVRFSVGLLEKRANIRQLHRPSSTVRTKVAQLLNPNVPGNCKQIATSTFDSSSSRNHAAHTCAVAISSDMLAAAAVSERQGQAPSQPEAGSRPKSRCEHATQ